jgi:hypothetical protein
MHYFVSQFGFEVGGTPMLHHQGNSKRDDDDQEQERAQTKSLHEGGPVACLVSPSSNIQILHPIEDRQ